MKKILILFILSACSEEGAEEPPRAHTEYTMCTDVDGVCVVEESFSSMNIDYSLLSSLFNTLEYEVNFYYPGLNFSELAEQNELKLLYKWADWHTQYSGTYDDNDATARVYLRKGEAITEIMECMDRYYISLHEVLHFISNRYLLETYENGDVHYVPYIFKRWALVENLPVDYTVEGRLYTMVWRVCNI